MAQTPLLTTYNLLSQENDPQNPGVYNETYEVVAYVWDTVTKERLGPTTRTESYAQGYPGAPAPPQNFSWPTDVAVDTYTVPGVGQPGYVAGKVGQVATIMHDGEGGIVATYAQVCDLQIGEPSFMPNGDDVDFVVSFTTSAGDGQAELSVNGLPYNGVFFPSPVGDTLPPGEQVTLAFRDRNNCVGSVAFTVPLFGCTDPEADNFNVLATADDGSCVFFPRYDAVHLPVLWNFTAPATLTGETALLFVIDTTPDAGATWNPIASLRRLVQPGDAVQLNLSEYLKAQFSIEPPVEGADPNLLVTYRIRYGALPDFTGPTGTPIRTTRAHYVLNATVPIPADDDRLSTAAYSSVPVGALGLRTDLDRGNQQVVNTATLAESATAWPCAARQLFWLNERGGWDYGFWLGKHERGVSAQGGTVVRDYQNAPRYTSRGVVQPTATLYSDRLTLTQAQVLWGIRRSIQVYERTGLGTYIPVIVQEGSFREYQETDKLFFVDVTLAYPPLLIQTQ
ncbi:hypothetical protein HER32_11945 [Hymenobacter sp. BT18]|uniref:hypothetical protein n=1 Tax=Hymenobacter sp. BT18 TaxID=2835648 RepID=UPI00143E5BBA|nr:hypothetical protein [Hymenobacter sp. BT18]QIX61854.1 hypothetical protein HER32_11945 [Hymenobacter sp. BT18]